mmetsp:Transcript_28228/g.69786  ORF Transcript_28228/g.69786 Transcript_28228/m.69786 type:complete len:251 (+) Transcript_28228:416-1168(+)
MYSSGLSEARGCFACTRFVMSLLTSLESSMLRFRAPMCSMYSSCVCGTLPRLRLAPLFVMMMSLKSPHSGASGDSTCSLHSDSARNPLLPSPTTPSGMPRSLRVLASSCTASTRSRDSRYPRIRSSFWATRSLLTIPEALAGSSGTSTPRFKSRSTRCLWLSTRSAHTRMVLANLFLPMRSVTWIWYTVGALKAMSFDLTDTRSPAGLGTSSANMFLCFLLSPRSLVSLSLSLSRCRLAPALAAGSGWTD